MVAPLLPATTDMPPDFNPMSPEFLADPYPNYERLREEAPVFRPRSGVRVISRYEDVNFVLRSPELFSSSPMGGSDVRLGEDGVPIPGTGSLIAQDGPVHSEQRRIVSRGFTPRRIADMEDQIREISDALLDSLATSDRCDLMTQYANPLPVTMIAALLGLDPARGEDFKRWANTMVGGAGIDPEQRARDLRDFRDHIFEHIASRRECPADDLVSTLINAEEQDGILEPNQVFAFASLLLIAGAETTSNLIGNLILALDANPQQRRALVSEPDLIAKVLDEGLRYDAPVQMAYRLCTTATEVAGVEIKQGTFVIALIGSANRDPRRFDSPDLFDIRRDATAHLGFGFGPHYCLGASLARLQTRVAITSLLERFPDFGVEVDGVKRQTSFLVRGPSKLPLRLR